MTAYYNEHDPYAAAWLRNLIAAGLIADGIVDERSIEDVRPDELVGYTQCHFFAGIGGWSLALRLAGFPDDMPVWTGSCPCQPFSAAGKGGGFADERHLWPAFHYLIEQCRPPVVFGEQVASKDGLAWLDLVHADLEGAGYAVGAFDLCAAGVGAPHIRQRLWFVADADSGQCNGLAVIRGVECDRQDAGREESCRISGARGDDGRLADSEVCGCGEERAHAGRIVAGDTAQGQSAGFGAGGSDSGPSQTNGLWRDADWLFCRDGKWRPVEPGTFPLADGVPGRVGLLRGYGNAIVPEVAAEVINAYMEGRA